MNKTNKLLEDKIVELKIQLSYLDNKKKQINNLINIYSDNLEKNKKTRYWLYK
jgi:ribosomal protein S8